jgi:glutathione peroxidase
VCDRIAGDENEISRSLMRLKRTNKEETKYKKVVKQNFYQFKAKSLQGKEISMEEYKGKAVLVVNTASKCGLTPQYEGLEALYRKYKDDGLVILGFPSNQFANQEPGDEKSIAEGCLVNYGVTFPMFSKVDVNGESAHPLFKYLTGELGSIFGSKVKWNFTKFLIDRNGKPVKRFAPVTRPESMENNIKKVLEKR